MFYKLNRSNRQWLNTGTQIGTGWNFKQVFAGSGGNLYAINNNGDLLFFKHTGAASGTNNWGVTNKKIGNGWNFKQVFAGSGNDIYGVNSNGQVFLYMYSGTTPGSNWPIQQKQIDTFWIFPTIFAAP